MKVDFQDFHSGTLFLVRTPESFPEGYAQRSFADMKHNLHLDFAALLETWNCEDGTLWISEEFPRSSYWAKESRDPLEECFLAADQYGMAFFPEAGVMDRDFMLAHPEGMRLNAAGKRTRYGRIGLVPSCPLTLEYLKRKYDALLAKFGHHPSFCGLCLPAENTVAITYDRYTAEAYRKRFGQELPSPEAMGADARLEQQVFSFLEDQFLQMYRQLGAYLKDKYHLPLMHYPVDMISAVSFLQPGGVMPPRNLGLITRARELDLINLQLHPPLYPNPYFFKMETEYLMANAEGIPCMADTHWYHELAAGRLPDMTPKRFVDNVLSTLTPHGISFFCYGFMAEELPPWKKEINLGAPVYAAYQEPHTLAARREACLKAMDFVQGLAPLLSHTRHCADCAIYFPEELNCDYFFSSYPSEHIFGLHEMLNAAAIPLCFTNHIPSAAQCKALLLDSVKSLPLQEAEALERYLAEGGRVIVLGNCCPRILRITGFCPKESEALAVVSPLSPRYRHCLFRLPRDGRHYTETQGTPLLLYDNGEPAVTAKGKAIYFGPSDAVGRFPLLRDFYLAQYWQELLRQEGLHHGVCFTNRYAQTENGHQFTSCDCFENEKKKVLLLRNFGVEQASSRLQWDLPSGFAVTKALADGKEFTFENQGPLPCFEHFIALCAEKEDAK